MMIGRSNVERAGAVMWGPNIGIIFLAFPNRIWDVRCELRGIHSLDMGHSDG